MLSAQDAIQSAGFRHSRRPENRRGRPSAYVPFTTYHRAGSRGQSRICVFQVDYELYRMLADALIGVVWMGFARCEGGAAGGRDDAKLTLSALVQWPVEGQLPGEFHFGPRLAPGCESCANAWASARSSNGTWPTRQLRLNGLWDREIHFDRQGPCLGRSITGRLQ